MKHLITTSVTNMLMVLCLFTTTASADFIDPLESPVFDFMVERFFPNQPYEFDERVKVVAPPFAENSSQLPVSVDASALGQVQKILIFSDLNPFQNVLEFEVGQLMPKISFSIKMQQGTPVRAAALTADGIWHIGGVYVDAVGGGCSAPSIGVADPAWQNHLGQISSRLFKRPQGTRLKLSIVHPQDTGMAAGIPEFFLQTLEVKGANGSQTAYVELFQPVSENPVFTFEAKQPSALSQVYVRDNNGNEFNHEVKP